MTIDKATFRSRVDALLARQNDMTAQERSGAVETLCDEYVRTNGHAPEPKELERLANFILGDELRSHNKRGSTPVYTDNQLAKQAKRAGATVSYEQDLREDE